MYVQKTNKHYVIAKLLAMLPIFKGKRASNLCSHARNFTFHTITLLSVLTP